MSEDDETFPFYAKGKTPSAAISPYPESRIAEKMRMKEDEAEKTTLPQEEKTSPIEEIREKETI